MQVTALEKNRSISTSEAKKGKTYFCPECRSPVRLRSGTHLSPHFFHLNTTHSCRSSQKGEIHLKIQHYLKNLLASEDPVIEQIFPEINRIADVACHKTKKIFEVQYSPISLDEVRSRCQDYASLGYHIIWILHEDTFNKKNVSPSEFFLRTKNCYYTDMKASGEGMIYDQLEKIVGRTRRYAGYRSPVTLTEVKKFPRSFHPRSSQLLLRARTWPFYHTGDWVDLYLKKKMPKEFEKTKRRSPLRTIQEAYLAYFYELLSRSSK
ncbi:MAG: hypothetical protein KR126chlam1_01150 [Chlamydiae bacterium]|nr:hypothetical protein [Chlamydiota bacterium]